LESHYKSGYILRISFISALGGYLFGFDFAVIAGALPFLKAQFALDPLWEGFLTGSLAIGCMIGCLIAGIIAEKYGRKPGLMTAALVFCISSIGMALSPVFEMFIFMRFLAGTGVGIASILSPMYIAEISPAEVRGRNVAINQLTIVLGILITNIVNYRLADIGPHAWRWMFGLGAFPSVLFITGVIWLPESPRWLIKAGHVMKSETVLNKIGSPEFVKKSITDIQRSLSDKSGQNFSKLFSKAVFPAVLVGIVLAMFQQFCGINVVFNYTSKIFESAGADLNRQLLETVSIGFVNLVFTLIAMWQVDKLGRKPLMLLGSGGLAVFYIIIALFLKNHISLGFLSLSVLLAIGMYSLTLAPVTWVLISEIFPNKIRESATSLAVLTLWFPYFILVFTFPVLSGRLGTYTVFFIYSAICVGGFTFICLKVRETKGKTLEEMENLFTGQ
jgi:MFS transporter, SP family, xylose:H+ symportor